jgi:exodeoxyribonuclease-5
VAITRAENRLIWVVRNRLARPSRPLVVDDLTVEVPNFELTREPFENQKDGTF